ncbi:unnamed protein product [Rangifer tarandus platyrhynchus]|uniref:Uncharacterized protein n=2 Tax=Rangifer tarandus platyrhynchus TaxID=3082113 RepID=A0AC60A7B3_RANTA|nr:unnamed protein product [Rangifer tarandus platyrhynchus]
MQCEYRDNGLLASLPPAIPLSTLLLLTFVNLQIFPSFTEYSWSLLHPNPVTPQGYFGGSVDGPYYSELTVSQSAFFHLWEVLKGVEMKRINKLYDQINLGTDE